MINCMDEPSMDFTSTILDKVCQKLQIPFITEGGYSAHQSSIGYLVVPKKTLCFTCIKNAVTNHDSGIKPLKTTDEKINYGSITSIATITANLQVIEALKFLTGFSEPQIMNTHVEFDFIKIDFYKVNLTGYVNHSCSVCIFKNGS